MSQLEENSHETSKKKRSETGFKILLYSCTCSGEFTCEQDDSIKGSITSAPHGPFTSISRKRAEKMCKDFLEYRLSEVCDNAGKLILSMTPTCSTSEQSSLPKDGENPPPPAKKTTEAEEPKQKEDKVSCSCKCSYNVWVYNSARLEAYAWTSIKTDTSVYCSARKPSGTLSDKDVLRECKQDCDQNCEFGFGDGGRKNFQCYTTNCECRGANGFNTYLVP